MKQRGFTLIELMIVVVVIAVLAAIAYPNYQDFVTRARRTDAMNALQDIANLQEKFFSVNLRYTTTIDDDTTDGVQGVLYPKISEHKHYTLLVVQVTADPSFILEARPQGAQAGNGRLRLHSNGIKQWDKDGDNDFSNAVDWTER